MSSSRKIRRRMLLGAGFALVLTGLALAAHLSVVRRFALTRIQSVLAEKQGLLLETRELNYNLLSSWFELNDVAVRSIRLAVAPLPLKARRIVVRISVWRLLRASFENAEIRIDGLALQRITDRNGQSNWPALGGFGGNGNSGAPAILVSSGEFSLRDEQNDLQLRVPIGHFSAVWKAAKQEYAIACHGAGGELHWRELRMALDQLQLKAAFVDGGFAVETLRIVSGASNAEIGGVVRGSPAQIEATATLKMDMRHLGQTVRGSFQAHIIATGPLEAPKLTARLRGENVVVRGVPVRGPAVESLIDTGTGEVLIHKLYAGVFGGRLKGDGRIWIGGSRGRSEFSGSLDGADLRQAGLPAGRAAVYVSASWPGLDWRLAALSGVARSGPVKVAFHARAGPTTSIHSSFDATLSGGAAMHGDVSFETAAHTLNGVVRGRIDSLARFGSDLEKLLHRPAASLTGAAVDGAARWSGTVGGTLELPSASLQLEANRVSIGGWNGADFSLKADYAADRTAIENAVLSWGGQQIIMKGEVGGLSTDAPLRLDGTVEGQSLAGVFENLGIAPAAEAAVSGEIRISGSLARPAVEATLRSGELAAYGQRFASASLNASWQGGELSVKHLAATGDGHVEASGLLDVGTGRYAIDTVGQNLRLAGIALPGGLPLTGAFQVEAHGEGTLKDPVLHADVVARDVKAGTVIVGEVSAKGDAACRRATAVLSAPARNVRATATIATEGAWPFELTLDARNTRVDTTPASSFDAQVHATGTLSAPRLERVTAGIHNFKLAAPGQEILSDGPIELSYADGRVRVGKMALKSGNSSLQVAGELPLEDGGLPGSLSLQGSVNLGPLSEWLPGLSDIEIGGVAEVNAAVTGNARNWQPSGAIAIRDGAIRWNTIPLPLEHIAGTLHLEGGAIRADEITGKAGTGTLRAGGSAPLGLISNAFPAAAAQFSAQLDKLELSAGSGEQKVTAAVGFKIEGEASALSVAALRARVEFSSLEANTKADHLQQAGPTSITIADAVARLERFDLESAGSRLRASGSMGLTGDFPLRLDISGKTELALLSVLTPPLGAAGPVRLDVRIGGTLSAPQMTGYVELEQASFTLPVPKLQAGSVKLRAEMEGDRVSVKELTGTLNGGTFRGGGDFKLGTTGIRDANLFLTGKDTFVEYPPSVKTISTLDLKLISRQDGLTLQGKVDIQEGYYESSLDAFKSEASIDSVTEVLPGPASRPLALDIQVSTKRPVEMDNNLGRLAGTADLRLGGNVQQPRIVGRLDLEPDGRLYFGDRTYYLERGTVHFLDAPLVTPELNIQAYTRTGDYTIRLGLTGELNEVSTTFTSDPPLSRDDVIAVLLTGKTVAENRGVDLRALEATSLATGALNASLSSQVHRTLGVSRVSIQPSAVAAESNPGARITITQDFTRSLRLLYSMNLSDSNDQIWVGEYDLSRHFTTRAVKQSDNSYRGEFRHDIRFGSSSRAVGPAAAPAPKQKISRVQFTGGGPFSPTKLAKVFKLKPGQQYKAMNLRKGSERLTKYLTKKRYLESRVRLDRDTEGEGVSLTVRIELGPVVELVFQGAKLSRRQKARVRNAWRAGISEQHRPQVAREAILDFYAQEGFLRAQAGSHATVEGDRKLVRFDLTPGINYRDVKVVVRGAESRRTHEIGKLVHERQLRLSVYRDPRRAIDAITRFYQQRGYLAAKVEPPQQMLDAARRTARIVIPVHEGPVFHVDRLQFSGNQVLTASDLGSGLPLEPGVVFEPARVAPALAALKLKYGKLGYREADIEYGIARHDDRASVDVSFTIEENKRTSVGRVAVEGNRHTTEKFARGQLRIAEGDVANTALVRESVKNLSQTGAYTSADISVQPQVQAGASDQHTQVADLVLAVTEPKPFRLLYGGLYDSGNGPGFIADFQNLNSLGAGRTLGLRTRVDSETDEARLYVSRPFWRRSRLSTTLSTYFTRETEYHQSTPTETLGFSIQQDLPFRSKWLLSYGYRYEKQRGFVPDPAAPDIPEKVVSVAPVTLTFSRDGRDSYLDATRGSFISHGFEFAPRFLGSDYPYLRYYVQYFKYFPLTRPRPVPFGEKAQRSRLIFASGSRVGLQKGFNKEGAVLTDRFYAGGGTTVRGFRQDELGPKLANGQPAGGNAVVVLNEELRYPLFWIFDAVSFVDVGNVFPRVSDFRISELRTAGGFGLRIRNPFVVLRFDYGFKFDRRPGEKMGAFFFSIGQAF